MFVKPFWLLSVMLCLIGTVTEAQSGLPDTLSANTAETKPFDFYTRAVASGSALYNGPEYKLYPPAYKGSPYFQEKSSCSAAMVCYNGTWYKNVSVIYDLYNDVLASCIGDSLYTFRSEKVSDFYLSDHHFVNLATADQQQLSAGYYDQLYNSKSRVLVKRARTVQNAVTQQTVEVSYENNDVIYIKNGNTWYRVSSKGSVLDVFNDKKKQLKQFLNDNHIKYNDDKEGAIVKLTSYYDQLSQ